MNSHTKRLRTFYSIKRFTVTEVHLLTVKGFYYSDFRLVCYKCESSYGVGQNTLNEVETHLCTRITNNKRNIEVASPYVEMGAINVQNDLNYEVFRYETFTKFGMTSIIKLSARTLASAGFYYALSPQTLKCFYCKTFLQALSLPNRTFAEHKTNRNCQQKQFSFQIRINNLIQDQHVSKRPRDTHRITAPCVPQAGPSTMCKSPTIESSVESNKPIQHAFDNFLSDPEKYSIYSSALNLGFDKYFVNSIIKRRLTLGGTFENVEELMEFGLTFYLQCTTAHTIASKMEQIEREMECKICMSEKVSVIFMPCHHVVACLECGHKVNKCPMCCKQIEECTKIYF